MWVSKKIKEVRVWLALCKHSNYQRWNRFVNGFYLLSSEEAIFKCRLLLGRRSLRLFFLSVSRSSLSDGPFLPGSTRMLRHVTSRHRSVLSARMGGHTAASGHPLGVSQPLPQAPAAQPSPAPTFNFKYPFFFFEFHSVWRPGAEVHPSRPHRTACGARNSLRALRLPPTWISSSKHL